MSELHPTEELNRCFSRLTESFIGGLTLHGLANHLPVPPAIEIKAGDTDMPADDPNIFRAATEKVELLDIYPRLAGPVGAYGRDWTTRLILTGANLMEAATKSASPANIMPLVSHFEPWEQDVFDDYTYRQSRRKYKPIPNYNRNGEDMTMRDGLQALTFTSILFTSHKVPGYETPRELLTQLAASGVFSAFARKVPFSIVTRMAHSGTVFVDPPVVKRNHKWRVRPELLEHFDEGAASGKYSRCVGNTLRLDRPGCPVARRHRNAHMGVVNAVDLSAKVMANLVESSPLSEVPVLIYGPDDW